jgi:hypothetical protein
MLEAIVEITYVFTASKKRSDVLSASKMGNRTYRLAGTIVRGEEGSDFWRCEKKRKMT